MMNSQMKVNKNFAFQSKKRHLNKTKKSDAPKIFVRRINSKQKIELDIAASRSVSLFCLNHSKCFKREAKRCTCLLHVWSHVWQSMIFLIHFIQIVFFNIDVSSSSSEPFTFVRIKQREKTQKQILLARKMNWM